MQDVADIEMRLLLEAIFQKYHYDFRGYSMASATRRLPQALRRSACASFSVLPDRVLREPELAAELLPFLTGQGSEMFRDPNDFQAIRTKAIPLLRPYPARQVWVAGCSGGEE